MDGSIPLADMAAKQNSHKKQKPDTDLEAQVTYSFLSVLVIQTTSKTKFTAIPLSKRNLFTGRRFDPVGREQGQLRGGSRRDVHGHQADHAHRAHPPLHALHHGHRHPLRLLLRHQAAPGRLGARGAV